MGEIFHSVTLDKDKCHGCTNCIKMCPTQAIRVRNGKAKIIKERCIDCGECIRVCPYHAKKAITNSFDVLKEYKYNIALPAPTFYGQFSKVENINLILNALKKIGFDDVFEVAYAAQIISNESKKIIAEGKIEKPVINSACPTVVKLICARFPSLIDHILPVISPMNFSARMARAIAKEKTGFTDEQIGVFFITPCAAKATCAHIPIGADKSYINGTFSVKDTYLKVLPYINSKEEEELSKADFDGVCWAVSGGEAAGISAENYIAVDGINNVIQVMDAIENDKMTDIDFVEALACVGGCVGGPLNVENNFVAKARIKKLRTKMGDKKANIPESADVRWNVPVVPNTVLNLDDNLVAAMQKMEKMNEIYETLPKLDCGSCGAPSCKALSEDIVRGFATETDCIFKFREKISDLAKEMMDIENH